MHTEAQNVSCVQSTVRGWGVCMVHVGRGGKELEILMSVVGQGCLGNRLAFDTDLVRS